MHFFRWQMLLPSSGPFSHLFDSTVIPALLPGMKWSHEKGSEMMLEKLITDNGLDFERSEITFLKDIISGAIPPRPSTRIAYDRLWTQSQGCLQVPGSGNRTGSCTKWCQTPGRGSVPMKT